MNIKTKDKIRKILEEKKDEIKARVKLRKSFIKKEWIMKYKTKRIIMNIMEFSALFISLFYIQYSIIISGIFWLIGTFIYMYNDAMQNNIRNENDN